MQRVLKNFVFYGVLLAVWAYVAHLKVWPPYLFPAPKDVLLSLHDGFADRSFWIAIAVSMKRVGIGYLISVALGLLLALLLATSTFLDETLGPLLTSLQNLPSICWLPLALLWFGLSENAIYFVIIMGSTPSITMAVESGLRSMPPIYPMAGRNLGASGVKLFLYVLLPASLPHVLAGLKQCWAFAWRALFSAEMLYVTLGLGQQLMMGRDLNDMSQVLAVMLLVLLLGLAVNLVVFRTLQRALARRWGLVEA